MKIYSKYIFNYLAKIFVLSTFVLTGILTSVKLLSFINQNMLSRGVGATAILKFVSLSAPHLFMYLSPIAVACSIIYVHHTFTIDNEFTVLESSGLSKFKTTIPIVLFSILVAVIGYIMVMSVVPAAKLGLYKHMDAIKHSPKISEILEEKSFNKISKNITIYMDKKSEDGLLHKVAIYHNNTKNSQVVMLAKKAKLNTENNQLAFRLYDGSRHSTSNGSSQILYFKELKFEIPKNKFLTPINTNADIETFGIIKLLKHKPENSAALMDKMGEVHRRFAWPIANITTALIVLSSIISRNFSRDLKRTNISHAVLLVALNLGISILLQSRANKHIVLTIALYLVPASIAILCLYVLRAKSDNKQVIPNKIYNKLPKTLQTLLP